MTIEEKRKWLGRARKASRIAQALERLVQRSKENATGLSRGSECNDKGKSSTQKNGTESVLIHLADIERQMNEHKHEAEAAAAEIYTVITDQIKDDELAAVLINRYLNYMTAEETAEFMGYDVRTIYRKTDAAVKKLSVNVMVCHHDE